MAIEKNTLDELKIDRSAGTRTGPHRWVFLLVLALLGGASLAGWWWQRLRPVPVRTLVLWEGNGGAGEKTVLNSSGYVTARRQATVSSKVTGKVIETVVEEGMKVEAGQVLARLDDSNAKASLALAQSQQAATRASLNETRVRVEEAEAEFKRVTELTHSKIATASDLDKARANLNSLKAHLGQQESELEVALRQVAVYEQQLDDMIIRAPFTGVVISKNAQVGEMISPISAGGGFTRTGICTIVDMASLEIEVDVNESYINRVESGRSVEATLDSYPDWKIPSKVIAIIPTADRQKATVKVRIGFDKLDPRILPDMGVKVAFAGGETAVKPARTGFVVPKSALRQFQGREVVLVASKGRVECRAIKKGVTRGDDVSVIEGLAAGDKVVVEGPGTLKAGDRVEEIKP